MRGLKNQKNCNEGVPIRCT